MCKLCSKISLPKLFLLAVIIISAGLIFGAIKFIDKDLPFSCGTSMVADIDGNIYKTVKIGNQCWMKENLKVAKNPQGAPITRYCYNNDFKNCETDGGLYDWNTAMNKSIMEGNQGICPDGWHIPKDSEWYVLEKGLATNSCSDNKDKWDCDSAGAKLKIGGSSGFEGILAGYRYPGGTYDDRGVYAKFWSSMENGINAWHLFLYSGYSTVSRQAMDKRYSASIRCFKD